VYVASASIKREICSARLGPPSLDGLIGLLSPPSEPCPPSACAADKVILELILGVCVARAATSEICGTLCAVVSVPTGRRMKQLEPTGLNWQVARSIPVSATNVSIIYNLKGPERAAL
jgi:hypothetical protein